MPRPTLLPTPASSTDIKGTDGSKLAPLQLAFELPPPAVASHDSGAPRSPTSSPDSSRRASKAAAATAPYPLQASERVKARRRLSAGAPPKEQFVLPPPPTRSRKIIQMKPREEAAPAPAAPTGTKAVAATTNSKSAGPATTAAAGPKKKPPSATSAAGRKIARKTAHSLIERRRRSKMNEEFAVLKDMIPACSGEMHKLAILQASIEYVKYLEDCVAKLKEENARSCVVSEPPAPFRASVVDAHSSDVDMTDSSPGPSPVLTPNPITFQQPMLSPALLAGSYRDHRGSLSSAPGGGSRGNSATTSPALEPQGYGYAHSLASIAGSALTSPALLPQRDRDLDQEATAALLMLNQTDRRGSIVRGMSVKDLLSS